MSKKIRSQAALEKLPDGTMIYLDTGLGRIVGKLRRSKRNSHWPGMECLSENALEEWFRIDISVYGHGKSPYYLMTDEEAMLWILENG